MLQQPVSHNDLVCTHLYHKVFAQGLYSDLVLRIQRPTNECTVFKLHRILAIRSPYLESIMKDIYSSTDEHVSPIDINLSINDPNITTDGLSLALGHLYGSFAQTALQQMVAKTSHQYTSLLCSVLAAAHLLCLKDLEESIVEMIKGDVHRSTILEYCEFVSQDQSYGPSGNAIREAVFHHLCKGLVHELVQLSGPIWGNRSGESFKTLVHIFSQLPFEWLKKIVESPNLEIPSDMERYYFAKEVILQRSHQGRNIGEENVLLSFGKTSGVTIVRKIASINERRVWKVQE